MTLTNVVKFLTGVLRRRTYDSKMFALDCEKVVWDMIRDDVEKPDIKLKPQICLLLFCIFNRFCQRIAGHLVIGPKCTRFLSNKMQVILPHDIRVLTLEDFFKLVAR